MAESNAVKRVEVAEGLSGLERLKLLLAARGYPDFSAWAKRRVYREGQRPFGRGEVWHAVSNRRPNSPRTKEIREALAEDTGKSLRVIEALIAGQQPAED